MNNQLTSIDLFCGSGGITEGFGQSGFSCVFANDLDADAIRTFKLNHPAPEANSSNIEALDPQQIRRSLGLNKGELDCVAGGPPCQGFSINAPGRFLDDPRNALFRHFVEFVREFEPKTIFFENVPGLVSFEDGFILGQIAYAFTSLGYNVRAKILLAAHYGVPQERWRLIMLAAHPGISPEFPEPRFYATGRANFTGGRELTFSLTEIDRAFLAPMVTVHQAIGDLPRLAAGEGQEYSVYDVPPHSVYSRRMRADASVLSHHVSANIASINLERVRHIPPGGSWRDIPFDLLPAGMKKARRSDHTKRYGRLKADGLAGTVMTKMDPHWGPAFHYSQDRTLTVREAARLQSFSDSYRFYGSRISQYRQVGNAVPPFLAAAVAGSLRRAITGNEIDHRAVQLASTT